MPLRAIIYLKAGTTSVPTGHLGEPSVIWGNPKGIWHGWMRSWEWAELGMLLSSLQASITKSLFTLCCLYLCVSGARKGAPHGCWNLTFAVMEYRRFASTSLRTSTWERHPKGRSSLGGCLLGPSPLFPGNQGGLVESVKFIYFFLSIVFLFCN